MLANICRSIAGIFRELSLTSCSIQAASRDRYQFRRTLHAPRCSLFSARSCARPLGAAASRPATAAVKLPMSFSPAGRSISPRVQAGPRPAKPPTRGRGGGAGSRAAGLTFAYSTG